MPGPGAKNRNKKSGKGSKGINSSTQSVASPTPQPETAASVSTKLDAKPAASGTPCQTLLEDEMTRCGEPATVGKYGERRCRTHHSQYLNMYKKYKAAGETVDSIRNSGQFPSATEIKAMKDRSEVVQKLRWLASYVEAIRVERYGRKIHSDRFFLKIDAGHKTRINILAKEMEKVNELRKELGKQLLVLHAEVHPEEKWTHPWDADRKTAAEMHEEFLQAKKEFERSFDSSAARTRSGTPDPSNRVPMVAAPAEQEQGEDDDLIEIKLQRERRSLMAVLEPFLEIEDLPKLNSLVGVAEDTEAARYMGRITQVAARQYLRRAVYYNDALYYKTLDKVSFKDWFLSPDFDFEDALALATHFKGMTAFGLLWLKDSVYEAVETVRRGDEGITAQLGDVTNRVNVLGGWVYRRKYTKKVSDQVWWHLYAIADIEPKTENRMVRLCNSYDDITGFLSVAAFRPKPDSPRYKPAGLASSVPRMHLSISDIVIADMTSPKLSLGLTIAPTRLRARKLGNIVWAQMEFRSYIFGAVRQEQEPFTERFLAELKARPDLFQLVIWDSTLPESTAQEFGSEEGGRALPQMRARNFEAPISSGPPTEGHGPWVSLSRSARDVLFAPSENPGKGQTVGYIPSLRREKGWFFSFKDETIAVRYFVILDTTPNRDVSVLMYHAAWMALRAGGYANGEFTHKAYREASDQLFEAQAKRRLSWQPSFFGTWTTTKLTPGPSEQQSKGQQKQPEAAAAPESDVDPLAEKIKERTPKNDSPRDSPKAPKNEEQQTSTLGILAGAAGQALGSVLNLWSPTARGST